MLYTTGLDAAKPRDKPYKLTDGNGLHLLVNPNGSKLWRFRYRFAGKQLMLSLGPFPEVSLATARQKRDEARRLLTEGTNPSQQRRHDRIKAQTAARNTFGAIAGELISKLQDEGKAPATIDKQKWFLEDLASDLASRPIAEITAAEILVVLRKVERQGHKETARRLRGAIGRVYRYAIATLRAENDPTYALRGALTSPIVTNRAAITDEAKLGHLLKKIDAYDGRWPTLKTALKFLVLTMARPCEVRFLRKSEVNFIKHTWTVPAERMKMRRPHEVPLSNQALVLLQSVWEDADGLIFPSLHCKTRPLSENAFNSALRRMGFEKHEVTSHGFRASASTILNEHGFNPDVIEAALAHQDKNAIRRAYNRTTYWSERVQMMQRWADMLDEFKKSAQTRSCGQS
jgi:integrase